MKIVVRALIELAGFPKENIEKGIKSISDQLDKTSEIKVISKEVAEVKEVKKIWASFVETELEFTDLKELLLFNIQFLPSSVEILEPEKLTIDTNDFTDFMNTMQAKLHEYNAALSKLIIKNKVLEKKVNSPSP
tara:strand:+ start:1633 stop:2034 length:402 start_codon:yes stop_codon:yes gene_type:complete